MNKSELKAFDKLIDNAASKCVNNLQTASFDITHGVFLALCKATRDKLDNMIHNLEND